MNNGSTRLYNVLMGNPSESFGSIGMVPRAGQSGGDDFFSKRFKSLENALGTTGSALISAVDTANENQNIENRLNKYKQNMDDIYKKYGYNSSDEYYDAKDAAEKEIFGKYGFDSDAYWNKHAELWSPNSTDSKELRELDASRQSVINKMSKEDADKIKQFDAIQEELKGQSKSNADDSKKASDAWRNYRENSYVGKKVNQDRGKFAGSAINTLSTMSDVLLPGAGVAFNAAQGGIEGIADELEQNGLDNFSLERAGQNALTGAVSGGVVGGLNKGLSGALAKRGGNLFKGGNRLTQGLNELGSNTALGRAGATLATGAGRGALSGAVGGATGAGLSAAMNGQDVLGSAVQGAMQGAQQGAIAGGVMSGVNMAANQTPGVGNVMRQLNEAGENWQKSGNDFNERLTNTLTSGDSGIGNWLQGKPSRMLASAGQVGNSIRNVDSNNPLKGITNAGEAADIINNDKNLYFEGVPTQNSRAILDDLSTAMRSIENIPGATESSAYQRLASVYDQANKAGGFANKGDAINALAEAENTLDYYAKSPNVGDGAYPYKDDVVNSIANLREDVGNIGTAAPASGVNNYVSVDPLGNRIQDVSGSMPGDTDAQRINNIVSQNRMAGPKSAQYTELADQIVKRLGNDADSFDALKSMAKTGAQFSDSDALLRLTDTADRLKSVGLSDVADEITSSLRSISGDNLADDLADLDAKYRTPMDAPAYREGGDAEASARRTELLGLNPQTPDTLGGWLKKAGERIVEDANNRGMGMSIKNVGDQDQVPQDIQNMRVENNTVESPETQVYRALNGEAEPRDLTSVFNPQEDNTIQGRNKLQSIGEQLQNAAKTQKYGALYDSLDAKTAARAVQTGAPEKLSQLRISPENYKEAAKTSNYINQVVSDLAEKSGVKINVPDLPSRLAADNLDVLMSDTATKKYNNYMKQIAPDGDTPDQYSAGYLLQKSRELGNKAANLRGNTDDVYALRQALTDAKYKLRNIATDALEGSEITGDLTNDNIAKGLAQMGANQKVQDYYTEAVNGKAPSVSDYIRRSALFEQARDMGTQMEAEKFTRSASKAPTNPMTKIWNATGLDQPVNALLRNTVAPIASGITNLAGKTLEGAGNVEQRIKGNLPTSTGTADTTPTYNPDYNPQTRLYNAIGRTEGLTNAEKARTANYLASAAQEAEIVPNNTLEGLTTQVPATGATSMYQSAYGQTPQQEAVSGNSFFPSTGDYWTDILGVALTSAINANDVKAFGSLYEMYQDATAKLQKQANSSNSSQKLSSTQQRANAAMNSLDRLSGMSPDLGYNLSNIPVIGDIATLGGNDYESEARSLAQQIGYMVSGANIKEEEAANIGKAYVPQPWDSESTRRNKLQRAREIIQQYQNGMAEEA